MATFKPGQLVKKVRQLPGPQKGPSFPVGAVGVVVPLKAPAFHPFYTPDFAVRVGAITMQSLMACWEPVQYDGNQASNWDVGVWKPSHLREKENDSVLEVEKEATTATD